MCGLRQQLNQMRLASARCSPKFELVHPPCKDSWILQVANSKRRSDLQDPASRLCFPLQVGSASLSGIITDLQDRESCRIACVASIGLMEQHQQTKEVPGVAGQVLAAGGSTEHFASPFCPILGEGTMEDSFDNDELVEKRALDREVLSTESAKGEHESDLEHDR